MGTPVVHPPRLRNPEDQFQREVKTAIKILDAPGARKVTLTDISLGVVATLVAHQLGKRPVGWLIIDKNAQADVWRAGDSTRDTIPLIASAPVVVSIQVW